MLPPVINGALGKKKVGLRVRIGPHTLIGCRYENFSPAALRRDALPSHAADPPTARYKLAAIAWIAVFRRLPYRSSLITYLATPRAGSGETSLLEAT